MAHQKNTRPGGPRPGAGRPKELDEPVRVDFVLPEALLVLVDKLARRKGVSRSEVIRQAIQERVDATKIR